MIASVCYEDPALPIDGDAPWVIQPALPYLHQQLPLAIENLHQLLATITDIQISLDIQRHIARCVHLARDATNVGASGAIFLNPPVPSVGHMNVALTVQADALGTVQQFGCLAFIAQCEQQTAEQAELLHPAVSTIHDIQFSGSVDSQVGDPGELAGKRTRLPKALHRIAPAVEDMYPLRGVSDIDSADVIHGHIPRPRETLIGYGHKEVALSVEDLYARVACVGHVQVPLAIEGQALGIDELTVTASLAADGHQQSPARNWGACWWSGRRPRFRRRRYRRGRRDGRSGWNARWPATGQQEGQDQQP